MSADPDDESSRSGPIPGDTGDMEHVSASPAVPGRDGRRRGGGRSSPRDGYDDVTRPCRVPG
ncbi:hypothetical protein GT025_01275 [Streptomyces sp. SID4920]|nr:hypothetical protein [Streptomyces sp. SID4920]MYX68351.1 hypothetical protein [Streptomyces sp. SID8373]